jgi:xylan 1,4-beta-xylosidase
MYHNPVQRGFFPDPSVIRVGDDYYMVNSSFQYFPAIPISHSKDMVHWHLIGHAICDSDDLDLRDIPDSHGIWAPDIYYENGRFYIIATLRLNGDGKRGNNVLRRQLLVSADEPQGPYTKPIWLEEDDIDPSLFRDEDGKLYMIIAPGVRAVPLSDDGSKIIGSSVTLWTGTGERCPEGPHLFRKNGWYYAVLAEGGTGYGHGINIARSRTMFGTYEPSPANPVLRQKDPHAVIQRAGHGKPIQASDGTWWMYYLCGRRNEGNYTTIGRETALDPIEFTADGWFTVNSGNGPSTEQKAPQLPVCAYPAKTRWEFDKPELDLEWEFVRNPDPSTYSLKERSGWLRIYTRDGQLSERRAKNTLVHREQELSYEAETKLEFMPTKNGEQAGLTCYYSTATYVRFSLCWEEGRKLQLVINRNHGEELIAQAVDIKESAIYLKVTTEGLKRTFSYSYDGLVYETVGILENCIFLCDEGVPDDPKRHTGTLVGIYANNGGCGSRIPADFDFFSYQD